MAFFNALIYLSRSFFVVVTVDATLNELDPHELPLVLTPPRPPNTLELLHDVALANG